MAERTHREPQRRDDDVSDAAATAAQLRPQTRGSRSLAFQPRMAPHLKIFECSGIMVRWRRVRTFSAVFQSFCAFVLQSTRSAIYSDSALPRLIDLGYRMSEAGVDASTRWRINASTVLTRQCVDASILCRHVDV